MPDAPAFPSQAESAQNRTFFFGTLCSLLTVIDPSTRLTRQNRNTDGVDTSDQVAGDE